MFAQWVVVDLKRRYRIIRIEWMGEAKIKSCKRRGHDNFMQKPGPRLSYAKSKAIWQVLTQVIQNIDEPRDQNWSGIKEPEDCAKGTSKELTELIWE